MSTKKFKKAFGKHVVAFYGRVNDSPTRPMVSVSADEDLDGEPCMGEWLNLQEAERLAKNITKAVAALKAREGK